jgi:hypothetical protein
MRSALVGIILSLCLFGARVGADPAENTWTRIADLEVARFGHTATLLRDGRVLVTGGVGSHGGLHVERSAEIYDPLTGRWTLVEPMGEARHEHTATLLRDGRVLVAGGNSQVPGMPVTGLVTVELFDPATATWNRGEPLSVGRSGHQAVTLVDGTVLVAGGRSAAGFLTSTEIYDPVNGMWRSVNPLATARQRFAAIRLSDGRVLAAGGETAAMPVTTRHAEVFDPSTGLWSPVADIPAGMTRAAGTLMGNGLVVVVSNGLPFVFDPSPAPSGNWSSGGSAAQYTAAVTLADGDALLISNPRATFRHDIETGATTTALLSGNLNSRTVVRLHHGNVLLIGGQVGNAPSAVVQEFGGPFTNELPVAEAGPNQIVECMASDSTPVTLDGSASFDPDNDPLTFAWTGGFGGASGATATVTLPLGSNSVTLTATDPYGGSSTDTVMVDVVDTTAPANVKVSADVNVLWPPNGEMREVRLAAVAADSCGAAKCAITGVRSNEADARWEVTGPLTLQLEARRAGPGGRMYDVTVACGDAHGNSSTSVVTVVVPHNSGKARAN